jgi:hypothetical protein
MLCIAVNMYDEASAMAAIRCTAASRVHECQALTASMTTTTAANVAITDFNKVLTETRLSMVTAPDGESVGGMSDDSPDRRNE